MGMSPRIKAKKGRFGPGGFTPTISLLSPAMGLSIVASTLVDFVATASDPENGNVSADITWSNDYNSQVFTGADPTFIFNYIGSPGVPAAITVTAQYTDGTNVVTDSVIINLL